MPSYLLDTGILLGYVRGSNFAGYVEKRFAPSKIPNTAMVSVVNEAELYALSLRRRWGQDKQNALEALLRSIPSVAIRHPDILKKFAEIDLFNHRLHPTLAPPTSGHTMGDNDIWIAATASVLRANLLTTDHDFDHLHGAFLTVIYIDQALSPADV